MAAGLRIEFSGVTKRYGAIEALHDVTASTGDDWSCIGLLGRNGAGKTTLLRILTGLLDPTGGHVAVTRNGQTANVAGPELATFLPEKSAVISGVTGRQYLRLQQLMNEMLGVETNVALREQLIDQLGLSEHIGKLCRRMSKGNQRKTEIVGALSADVPLFIADELTEGLDVPSRLRLQEVLEEAARAGRRMLISSHDLSWLSDLCRTIWIIDGGRVTDQVTVGHDREELRARVASAFGMTVKPPEATNGNPAS